jgi:hypothetical protein
MMALTERIEGELVRVVAFCALGVLGLSFGTVFLFAYLALPVFAPAPSPRPAPPRATSARAEPLSEGSAPSLLEMPGIVMASRLLRRVT